MQANENAMVSSAGSLLFATAIATVFLAATAAPSNECVYTVYVRTGSIWKGGTDSIISAALIDSTGVGVNITNLEEWGGLMGAGYNYFERGNLDIFSGRGPCLAEAPCYMELYSDGTGPHHGWYCNYVEVTTTGPHTPCRQQLFTVEQWLATDAPPYELIATRDYCNKTEGVSKALAS
ncbi:PLAT domain-containing protein 3-like [Wolffia australiana]